MEIKEIPNDDFMQLAELNAKMYSDINSEINEFQATNTLIHFINNGPQFVSIGLYDETTLMGFVSGHALNEHSFIFTGIYLEIKDTKDTKNLIEYCFNYVEEKGFKFWEVDATNDNIASIVEKYGAEKQYTRYKKAIQKEQKDG